MRKWLLIIFSLIFGLVLNIAISWLAAFVQSRTAPSPQNLDLPDWILSVPSDWPEVPSSTSKDHKLGFTRFESAAIPPGWGLTSTVSLSGWPMRSMYTKQFGVGRMLVSHGSVESFANYQRELARAPTSYTDPTLGNESGWHLHDATVHSFMFRREVRLPLSILPIGFALNWILWSAVIGGSTCCLRTLQSRLRIRKDLCVKCAYVLAGLETCPECGTSAKPRRMQA